MRRWAVVLSAVSISLGAATTVAGTANAGNDNDPYTLSDGNAQAGPMGGIVPARDSHAGKPGGAGGGGAKNLSYHGGKILTGSATYVEPIYWGVKWGQSAFIDDKITGLEKFYTGLDGSTYMNSNTEYTNSAGAHVTNLVAYGGSKVDTSAAPSGAPSTSTILAEVGRQIANPVENGYYPVYVDTTRGSTGYCAWHSYGSVRGTKVQFAFFFNLDNDPGCDPGTYTGQWQHKGLAALGNVSGHELSEAVTDADLTAWYDQRGYENSDKCAWTWSGTVQLGSYTWKIQGNWSNKAYNSRSGYDGGGCVEQYTTPQ